jgi:hypothetical protein
MQPSNAQVQELPPELRGIVEGELGSGEAVQWVGRPIPSLLSRQAWPIVLFGIPWTAFAIFWIAGASGFRVPDFRRGESFFPLFGLPFVLIGLGMLSAPYWLRLKGGRTAYVLTDRRAIIVERGLWSTKVRSFAAAALGDIERKQRADGAGDIIFSREYRRDSEGGTRAVPVGFLAVAGVKEVEERIRGLLASAAQAPPT